MRLSRIGIALALATASFAALIPGCTVGQEGERCNPDLSHDECNAGLSCQQPANCPENYCCPISGESQNPYCQPGCNGGLASICAAAQYYGDSSIEVDCAAYEEAGAEAGTDAEADVGRDSARDGKSD
jgi:hypothetical protein